MLVASSCIQCTAMYHLRVTEGCDSRNFPASSLLRLPPSAGPYTFGRYEAWEGAVAEGAFPAPSQALALLHRLAADPGIAHVMRQHRWSVGLLAEMPPEGFVGISPVCILGYNTNQGQSIHLRLRTDDLKVQTRCQPECTSHLVVLTSSITADHTL